jgi:hypothetical protein
MKIGKAILVVLLSVAVLPAATQAKSQDTHLVPSTGHPRNPFMWLFGHHINHAPKHKR